MHCKKEKKEKEKWSISFSLAQNLSVAEPFSGDDVHLRTILTAALCLHVRLGCAGNIFSRHALTLCEELIECYKYIHFISYKISFTVMKKTQMTS